MVVGRCTCDTDGEASETLVAPLRECTSGSTFREHFSLCAPHFVDAGSNPFAVPFRHLRRFHLSSPSCHRWTGTPWRGWTRRSGCSRTTARTRRRTRYRANQQGGGGCCAVYSVTDACMHLYLGHLTCCTLACDVFTESERPAEGTGNAEIHLG